MRASPTRFAWLAVSLASISACNGLFGISEGHSGGASTTGSGGFGGTGGTASSSSGTTTSSSTGTGGVTSGSTSSTTGDGGEGGTPCNPGASCNGSVLSVCDATGQAQPTVDCGVPALCDTVGQKCNDFGRLSVGWNRVCAVDDAHDVHCWGWNGGQPVATGSLVLDDIHAMFVSPQAITGVQAWQMAVADAFQCALQKNGDVSCWGVGAYGELGLEPSYSADSNPKVPLVLPAVEIGAATGCACARLSNGEVDCWGLYDNGCHGDGATGEDQTPGPTPTKVSLPKSAVQLSVGDGAWAPVCARLVDGEVYCWGEGYRPTRVPGVTDAIDITVGPGLVFIRRPSGVDWSTPTVQPVGADGGVGSAIFSTPAPFQAPGASTATLIAAGATFCSAGSGPSVTCTPLYDGVAPVAHFETPVSVVAAGTIAELRSGYGNGLYATTTQCLRLSGVPFSQSVYCWGSDVNGAMGIGGPDYLTAPTPTGTLPAASSLRCGNNSTAAVLTDGSARYWGSGTTYVGNGVTSSSPSAKLAALGTNNTWVQDDDDTQYAYALKDGGAPPTLVFNGSTVTGQRLLAYPTPSFADALPSNVDLGILAAPSRQVVVYADPPHGITWNDCGIFGNGTTDTTTTQDAGAPYYLATVGSLTATAIAAYVDPYACPAHACVIDPSGALWCWESNDEGESGVDTAPATDVVASPTQMTVPGVTKPFVSVAKGYDFTCATDGAAGTGKVYCWGGNEYGQLGASPAPDYTYYGPTPQTVYGINDNGNTVPAVGVAAGLYHACAWLADKTVVCWGNNDYGQLGNGNFDDQGAPVAVTGLTNVTSVSAGNQHTCALRNDGSIRCWGSSYYGQVGSGVLGQVLAPVQVQGLP